MRPRDEDKLVISFARWLAGLSPKWGTKYYFERYKLKSDALKVFEKYRGLKVCPFCGLVFKRTSGYITHLVAKHKHEIIELVVERLR